MDDAPQIGDPEGDATAAYVGVYRVERRLGRGGMGEVFLAHDDRLDRLVAIKRIRRPADASEIDRERLRREARAVAKLNHPAIAQVYDVVLAPEGDSIVMEYVEGRTLAEALAAGDVDGRQASDVAIQVAEGLAEAHAHGLVHRDLKAENVMVTATGRAKILDFGLAKAVARDDAAGEDRATLTTAGAVVGTFSTLSPEQAAGRPVDARSDLFSFGVLLYELFTGRSPFRRRDRMSSLRSVLAEEPPPTKALRPELPAALSGLIEELLAKDPDMRPASAADVCARLRESSGEIITLGAPELGVEAIPVASDAVTAWATRPPTTAAMAPAGAATRGRRGWRWLAVAALLAVAGVAAILLRPPPPLYVVLAPPEISGEVPELVVAGVMEATLGYLQSLDGVIPIVPRRAGSVDPDPEDLRREEAADEVVRARLDCPAVRCGISFDRLRDDRRLGGVERFEIVDAENYLALAGAVKAKLSAAYPERRVRTGAPALDVEAADYRTYLDLRHRTVAGETLDDAGFEELLGVTRSSPRFLPALVLAADIARARKEWDRARQLLAEVRRLDATDPRPLATLVHVESIEGDFEAAESALEELEGLAPGSELALRARIQVLRKTGRHEEAAGAARRLVKGRPSWINRWYLADLAMALGRDDEARAALERLLESSPENQVGLEKLAALEMVFGDLSKAETLLRRLVDLHPLGLYHSNLGWVFYLRGRYEESAEQHRRAVAREPDNAHRLLNLALAEDARGDEAAARAICRRLLDRQIDDIFRAQCLARLGQGLDAIRVAARELEQKHAPEDRYQAAQVFALAGDRGHALVQVEVLLEVGYTPAWFRIPAFDSLAGDVDFEALLRRDDAP